MKKILSALCLIASIISLSSCKQEESNPELKSELFGTFTYQETLGLGNSKIQITHDLEKDTSNRNYIYSTTYPLNHNCEGTNISYNMDQRLKLNRDYTYKYDYTILLSNPGDWGRTFARLQVNIAGTFDYRTTDNGKTYSVMLSSPVSGTQTIYAFSIRSQGIYDWEIHNKPDMVIDYSAVNLLDNYSYDKYVASKIVSIDKANKILNDNIFFTDVMDYICQYSTY